MSFPIPDPNALRYSQRLTGALAPGAVLVSGVPVSVVVSIAGARIITTRAKFTCDGTLNYYFRTPDGSARYGIGHPSSVAVTANTEINNSWQSNGEPNLEIEFVPGANGAVTFCDLIQL